MEESSASQQESSAPNEQTSTSGRHEQDSVQVEGWTPAMLRSECRGRVRTAAGIIKNGDEEAGKELDVMEKVIKELDVVEKVLKQYMGLRFKKRRRHPPLLLASRRRPMQADPDQIVLASGHTFDRRYYDLRWRAAEVRRGLCPSTHQPLAHHLVLPNIVIGDMVTAWCRDYSKPPLRYRDLMIYPVSPEHLDKIAALVDDDESSLPYDVHRWLERLSKKSGGADPKLPNKILDKLLDLFLDRYRDDNSEWAAEPALATMLNLSVNQQNRAVLAAESGQFALELWSAASSFSTPRGRAMAITMLSVLSEDDPKTVGPVWEDVLEHAIQDEDAAVRKEACMFAVRLVGTEVGQGLKSCKWILAAALKCLCKEPVARDCVILLEKLRPDLGDDELQAELEASSTLDEMMVFVASHSDDTTAEGRRILRTAMSWLHRIAEECWWPVFLPAAWRQKAFVGILGELQKDAHIGMANSAGSILKLLERSEADQDKERDYSFRYLLQDENPAEADAGGAAAVEEGEEFTLFTPMNANV